MFSLGFIAEFKYFLYTITFQGTFYHFTNFSVHLCCIRHTSFCKFKND
ncbi:hypothetical protein BAZSYMA_ACONTIG01532_0 [Bathymodiolus azoricus thioautotrophic gill symbiont]|uniref:Uncharacterized protein n=1 Tax=Bathymodiolus azoricus thioautotrophic gill symbiont TaxID=235205 RepID=A0A1H6KK23_9GAMM|nr:hypothetical protein BAZSYMA_ACONTIG01532_0 [Bathymodiolus azoricus thioautotrophic gill symbiont]